MVGDDEENDSASGNNDDEVSESSESDSEGKYTADLVFIASLIKKSSI